MSIRPPRTLAISEPGVASGPLCGWLEGVVEAGVDAVQLRCKQRSDAEVLRMARRARQLLPDGIRLLLNGRWDLALLSAANGVHLPAAGLAVGAVRAGLGEGTLVGRSTHSIDEVQQAALEGADYVTFGPVFSTPGKEIYGPPQGLGALERVAAIGLPILALGGITTIERLRECVAAGARGIAGIRLFTEVERGRDCVAALTDLLGTT